MSQKSTLQEAAKGLSQSAGETLDYAKKQGADRAKIATSCSFEKRLVIESKEFTLANTQENQKVGLLVHKDQKKGSATLNNTNTAALRSSVEDALALAKFSVADSYLTMPSGVDAPKAKALPFMFDDKLSELTLEELQEFAQAILTRLTKDKRVSLDKCEFSVSSSWHGLYNSLGVAQTESQTALSWSFFGMAVDGDDVSGFDYDGRQSYTWDGSYDLALKDADRFCHNVLSNLRPGKCPSYKGLILLTPRAVEEILIGTILYHASGSSVMDGKSKWNEDVGKQVVSTALTLTDSPHNPLFSGATAFDGDGLLTFDKTIIERGVLKMHLFDCYSANRTGKKSNAMSGGPFALSLAKGTASVKDMRNARPELLLVDRFSGNIDPIKGDFSGVAKSSRLIVSGKEDRPVAETMIAGNLFDALKSVTSVSDVQELISGASLYPWVLLDGVSVSGS